MESRPLVASEQPSLPGHQAVGTVEAVGSAVRGWPVGEGAGAGWLGATDGACDSCLAERENLCPNAQFTGYDRDGGYAALARSMLSSTAMLARRSQLKAPEFSDPWFANGRSCIGRKPGPMISEIRATTVNLRQTGDWKSAHRSTWTGAVVSPRERPCSRLGRGDGKAVWRRCRYRSMAWSP